MHTAKLFINGRSQAVRLPKDFRFKGDKVAISRMGNAIILQPIHYSWLELHHELTPISDFLDDREDLPPQERESL